MIKYEVIQHPHSAKHVLFKVTTNKGRVYAAASAWDGEYYPKPNEATVRYAWKHKRHTFLPYNETTGTIIQ